MPTPVAKRRFGGRYIAWSEKKTKQAQQCRLASKPPKKGLSHAGSGETVSRGQGSNTGVVPRSSQDKKRVHIILYVGWRRASSVFSSIFFLSYLNLSVVP